MWRTVLGIGLVLTGVAGVYYLMVWDAHILLLSLFAALCGAGGGLAFRGGHWTVIGAGVGFVAPIAYLPLWLAFDLPPHVGIDL